VSKRDLLLEKLIAQRGDDVLRSPEMVARLEAERGLT